MVVTNPFSLRSWTQQQIENVSRGWWILLLTGIISVLAGGIILITDWTVADLAVFAGAVLVFRGIVIMFSVPVDGAVRGWSVFLGLVEALFGVAVWVWPDITLLVLAFFAAFVILAAWREVQTLFGV